ncbi:hypothetical protein D210916BOD24_07880 [Alteromonas sp. D210916BOD_24]|uniref:glycosyltransferase domain-containing protein n=1 Tax=Alteromonas sp. D210916BOD_24 TaxID=3157618 RepID=UPI00399C7055
MKRYVVYSVITGAYDEVLPLGTDERDVDYVLVVDNDFSGEVPLGWNLLKLPKSSLNYKDLNRYVKMHPHFLFPQYDCSVYVDGNIQVISSLKDLIDEALDSKDIALYQHYQRNDVYSEAIECLKLGLEYFWRVIPQMKKYKAQGFKGDSLYEASVIFRKHHSPSLKQAMEHWWNEYLGNAKRDQLSLTFCLSCADVVVNSLGTSDPRINKKYFVKKTHLVYRPDKWSVRLTAKLNKLFLSVFPQKKLLK